MPLDPASIILDPPDEYLRAHITQDVNRAVEGQPENLRQMARGFRRASDELWNADTQALPDHHSLKIIYQPLAATYRKMAEVLERAADEIEGLRYEEAK